MQEEEYVDDIPFNTELIATQTVYIDAVEVAYAFEAEAYVDDIPFNTKYIAVVALAFEMDEEAYVDDIPFDTRVIANESLLNTNCVALKK